MSKITRRKFLHLWQGVLGIIAGLTATPTLFFWWRDQSESLPTENWIEIGKAKKIPENKWFNYPLSFDINDRWKTRKIKEILYIYREGRNITILSSVCPHAGCLIKIENEGFVCPCHKSFFDNKGSVVEGPSPRSLDVLKWRVRKGRLFVKYQQFRSGIDNKETLG